MIKVILNLHLNKILVSGWPYSSARYKFSLIFFNAFGGASPDIVSHANFDDCWCLRQKQSRNFIACFWWQGRLRFCLPCRNKHDAATFLFLRQNPFCKEGLKQYKRLRTSYAGTSVKDWSTVPRSPHIVSWHPVCPYCCLSEWQTGQMGPLHSSSGQTSCRSTVTIQFRPSCNQTKNPEVIPEIFCIGFDWHVYRLTGVSP